MSKTYTVVETPHELYAVAVDGDGDLYACLVAATSAENAEALAFHNLRNGKELRAVAIKAPATIQPGESIVKSMRLG